MVPVNASTKTRVGLEDTGHVDFQVYIFSVKMYEYKTYTDYLSETVESNSFTF